MSLRPGFPFGLQSRRSPHRLPIGRSLAGFAIAALLLSGCAGNQTTAATDGTGDSAPPAAPTEASVPADSADSAVDPATDFPDLPRLTGKATVVLTVNGAPITIEVDGDKAPLTAGNFVDLAQKGIYDGTVFHRVVREPQPFVVQGGDPQGKDPSVPVDRLGTGSYMDESGKPRYIPLEILPERAEAPVYGKPFAASGITKPPVLKHNRGAVAMARSQFPDSASAQFYFTLDNVNFLDGDYAVFGQVIEGMDVVDGIEQGDVIDSVEVVEGAENLQS